LLPGLIDDYESLVRCLKQAQDRIELLEAQSDARNADLCGQYEELQDLRAEIGKTDFPGSQELAERRGALYGLPGALYGLPIGPPRRF
jgi:hypothetical protein